MSPNLFFLPRPLTDPSPLTCAGDLPLPPAPALVGRDLSRASQCWKECQPQSALQNRPIFEVTLPLGCFLVVFRCDDRLLLTYWRMHDEWPTT